MLSECKRESVEMSGACSTHGDYEKIVQTISRDNSRERQPRKSGSQWEENINP